MCTRFCTRVGRGFFFCWNSQVPGMKYNKIAKMSGRGGGRNSIWGPNLSTLLVLYSNYAELIIHLYQGLCRTSKCQGTLYFNKTHSPIYSILHSQFCTISATTVPSPTLTFNITTTTGDNQPYNRRISRTNPYPPPPPPLLHGVMEYIGGYLMCHFDVFQSKRTSLSDISD